MRAPMRAAGGCGGVAPDDQARAESLFIAKVYPINSDRVDIRDQGEFPLPRWKVLEAFNQLPT